MDPSPPQWLVHVHTHLGGGGGGLWAGGGGGGGVGMCPLCRLSFYQGPGAPDAGDEVPLHGGEYSSVDT